MRLLADIVHRWVVDIALWLVVTTVVLAAASPTASAATSVWREGASGHPFHVESVEPGVSVSGDADQSVRLVPVVSWLIDGSSPIYHDLDPRAVDPRCIRPLGGGRMLIVNRLLGTDDLSGFIAVVRRDGTEEWSYRRSDDPQLGKPFCAERVVRGGQKLTLIADRNAARVFAVDEAKRVVWQYGVVGEPGLGIDRLSDPYWATYTDDDTVLIADNLGGHRVLEVRWSDYRADAPLHGFTNASIVWQYGTPGVAGSAPGQLLKPRSPQRLSGPARHTLITDADAHVVYEVDRAGRIIWQFGVVGDPGRPQQGRLRAPTYAERLGDGTTVIADTGNGLVVRVDSDGGVVRIYDMARLDPPTWSTPTDASEPRMATPAGDGSLLVADSGYARFVEVGLPVRASFTSQALDMGHKGVRKRFVSIAWTGEAQSSADVRVSYRIDSGAWRALAASGSVSLPSGAAGERVQYRVTLESAGRVTSPRLDAVEIRWRKIVASAARKPGGVKPAVGSGVAHMGGSDGPANVAGTVTWDDEGAGGGQGTGVGQGAGVGSGAGGRGAATAVSGAPDTAVAGAPAATDGTLVTGSAMRLSSSSSSGSVMGGGSGQQGSATGDSGVTLWAVLAVGAAVVVALVAVQSLRGRLTVANDVPAIARRDVQLLRGVR